MYDNDWLMRARKSGTHNTLREQRDGRNSWGIHHNGIQHYDDVLHKVIPGGSFTTHLNGHDVFDVFAPTSFVRELKQKQHIRSGVALSLTDTRTELEQEEDNRLGVTQLLGVFFQQEEWLPHVHTHLHQLGRVGFDTITCVPIGGWLLADVQGVRPPKPEQIWHVTNELWQLLDTNGTLFIKYATQHHHALLQWLVDLRKEHITVDIDSKNQVGALVKTKKSPQHIPSFTI